VFAHFQHADDPPVLDVQHHLRLSAEPLTCHFILQQPRVKPLERQESPFADLPGLEHLSHAAATQLFDQHKIAPPASYGAQGLGGAFPGGSLGLAEAVWPVSDRIGKPWCIPQERLDVSQQLRIIFHLGNSCSISSIVGLAPPEPYP